MLLDARAIGHGEVLDSDICVVGGGAAGLTLALELRDVGARVLVLESGGVHPDDATQTLYQGTSTGRMYYSLDECRLRYLGGSTNFWGGWCHPLEPIDFEKRAWIEYSGWPFAKADLDPYYVRAHAVCGLGRYDYDAAHWRDGAPPTMITRSWERLTDTIFQIAPTRFGHAYRSTIERADSVRLALNGSVIELEMDSPHRTTTFAHVATLAGNRFKVTAKLFVLASGGIETPRLLLASQRQRHCGIGNERGLVGRFFADHLHTPIALIPRDRIVEPFYLKHVSQGVVVRGAIALAHGYQQRERLLGCAVTLHNPCDVQDVLSPGTEPSSWTSLRVLARAIRHRQRPTAMWQHVRAVIGGSGDVLAVAYRKTIRKAPNAILVGCRAEQTPNRESRVTLSSATDQFRMPQAHVHWQLAACDLESLNRARHIWAELFARASMAFSPLPAESHTRWPNGIAPGGHHIGTTRMNADPGLGVVDENCRVHGTTNLYVAGSSVFPTAGWAPPTLTVVALTIRLADHIKMLGRR